MTRFTGSRKRSLMNASSDKIHDDLAFVKHAHDGLEVAILASLVEFNLHERRSVRCPHGCVRVWASGGWTLNYALARPQITHYAEANKKRVLKRHRTTNRYASQTTQPGDQLRCLSTM